MKYIKKFENENINSDIISVKSKLDIEFIVEYMSTLEKYINKIIQHYQMKEEQIHNLRLALEYGYLNYKDFRNIIGDVINYNYSNSNVEKKFKLSFEKNFKNKIIKLKKPYDICIKSNDKLEYISDLNSFRVNDIIGYIPKEYPFDKKYLVGLGRYRGDSGNEKTLWETYKNTTRESQFIKVFDEKDIYILNNDDIEKILIKAHVDKYNL